MTHSVIEGSWGHWGAHTPARLALGRAGSALPTQELLRFGSAHAMARDAVHTALDVQALQAQLQADGWQTECVRSRAGDRGEYLRRPDLGRQLCDADWHRLALQAQEARDARVPAPSLCLVVSDGLSAFAVQRQVPGFLRALRQHLPEGLRVAPVVIATQARVALADDVGQALEAQLVVSLIGERPGLSSPDSLGLYLTHAPVRGCTDAQRNCISNVRPEGLPHEAAAFKLAWLVREALSRGLTGVQLKDESDLAVLEAPVRDLPVSLPPQQI